MSYTLVGMGLKLHDVVGRQRICDLDQGQILADLRHAGVPQRQLVWLSLQPLAQFGRVLLASDEHTEKFEGAMLVRCHMVGETPFLAIEALSGGPVRRDEAMLQRMLAYLILRFDTLDDRPQAVLARTRNPSLCRVMRGVSCNIGGSGFYPEPNGSVISIRTAALAHRAARQSGPDCHFGEARLALDAAAGRTLDGPMLAMLDLRFVEATAMDDAARHLFRDRLPRSATRRAMADVLPLLVPESRALPRLPAHIAAQALSGAAVYPMFRR